MRLKFFTALLIVLLASQVAALNPRVIGNFSAVEKAEGGFSQQQLSALDQAGFFLVPTVTDQALDPTKSLYCNNEILAGYQLLGGKADEHYRAPENAIFVTADLLLHLYHILIDRTFQNIEEDNFYPTLLALTDKLYSAALRDYQKDPSAIKRNVAAYFLVPLRLLELKPGKGKVPAEIAALADEEVELITAASATRASKIFLGENSRQVDYTQFTPRSHYTKNDILRRYFRAMMWYGQMGFDVKSAEQTRMALYIVRNVELGAVRSEWESIYDPTVFFVGQSDDLTISDYAGLLNKVYGGISPGLEFAADGRLGQFQRQLQGLKGPRISPNYKSFRFMGQRFIPDSYVFSVLTQGNEPPDPEIGQVLPSTPTALMAMAAFGSDKADKLLNGWIKKEYPDSDRIIAKHLARLRQEFSALSEQEWTRNIYWSWLYTLKALLQKYDQSYPSFMRQAAWQNKSLLTALGSWTELRHDTLLYAKQSNAEMGGGGRESLPPVPKGYVEPNLAFFDRLIALNDQTLKELDRFKLLDGERTVEFRNKYLTFGETLAFLRRIALAELQGEPITDADFEKLRTVAYPLELLVRPVPYADLVRQRDSWMGLIADVHNDGLKGQILYEATGRPMKLFVLIKDRHGTRLTRGLTYSYYEFTRPSGKRLTDEDWQAIIYEKKGAPPPAPEWVTELIR